MNFLAPERMKNGEVVLCFGRGFIYSSNRFEGTPTEMAIALASQAHPCNIDKILSKVFVCKEGEIITLHGDDLMPVQTAVNGRHEALNARNREVITRMRKPPETI